MSFSLTSDSFAHGADIPRRFTCDGDNLSPALRWTSPPPGTRSLALIVHDPDAPRGDFTHWVLFDIPADTRELPEGAAVDAEGIPGKNDFGHLGYGGPCPPPGHGTHHYVFTLHALDVVSLALREGARRKDVEAAMQGHVLDKAELIGTYRR